MATSRKRSAVAASSSLPPPDDDDPGASSPCEFCQQRPAAVQVRRSQAIHRSTRTTTTVTQALCLLHYYTTSAIRLPVDDVTIHNPTAYQAQRPAVEQLFADAHVQLQQELGETVASALAASSRHKDPLAILHQIHKKAGRRKKAPPSQDDKNKAPTSRTDAGFWRPVATPERLVRTQREQARRQQALVRRMERAQSVATPTNTSTKPDLSKRRKSSRKSIWNVLLDSEEKDKTTPAERAANAAAESFPDDHTCTNCGSQRVRTLSSHTARDVRKGEIWGSGSASEVFARVQCADCGKMWNEEG
jgi:hypothetical protein